MASRARGLGRGGGKIRTRRGRQGPSRPYTQERQQHPGILSRLTDSIKNIVPGWLQRYFDRSEDVRTCSADTGEVPRGLENREDERLTQATEESANISDEKGTPAPTVDNTEEPSTGSFALDYTVVSTRPSLQESHLNVSMLESPALHHQPSTSSALPTGCSGFSRVKEIEYSTSQNDNSSTTAVFFPRASDKDKAALKNASVPPLWSTEAERSRSLPQVTAARSRKQALRLSAFGTQTLSSSLGNSSILKTNQLGYSPFYPAKTTYGGAAAPGRQSKLRGTPFRPTVIMQVKAKQLSARSYGMTSLAARRILQSLEEMSSPLLDAKRIPFDLL